LSTTNEAVRRSPLSRERVLAAAVALADRSGLGALTMRRLGQELGVEAMSLYKHVANKGEVLAGLAEAVLGEVELPTADDGWREGARRRAVSTRAALARHPWATVVLGGSGPNPAMLRNLDAVIGCLRRGGFSVAQAARALSLLDAYTYGYAVQEANLPFDGQAELAELTGSIMAGFAAGEYPHLAEMRAELIRSPGYDHATQFEAGLDLVLDALDPSRTNLL
jgi:AcrR family transcriptional regulator